MKAAPWYFVILALLVVVGILVEEGRGWDIRRHLGTKTPYWDQSTGFTPPPNSCYPVHVNLIARHGSREPTAGDVQTLTNLQKRIQVFADSINNTAYAWMKTWENPFAPQKAGWLTFQGEEEHYDLAKRFISYFPILLNSSYTPARFSLRSTQISRTGRSGNAFSYALFEGRGNIGKGRYDPFFMTAANLSLDYELRFFDTCPTYINEIANNASATVEGSLYAQAMFPIVGKAIANTIQLTNYTLDQKDVKAMWTACTLELSVNDDATHFCSLFPQPLAKIMNYYADLQAYWQKGYGYPIDYTIACPLMESFADAIADVITSPVDGYSQRANLRFAHAETVMPFLALLGLFKDSEPLRHNSSNTFIDNHLWVTSTISTYAANVALILYNCTDANNDFRVKLLVNEKEMKLPACSDLYCPLEEFVKIYKEPIVNCDFATMCGIKPCNTSTTPKTRRML